MATMRCYKLTSLQVEHITQDNYYYNYYNLPEIFGACNSDTRKQIWYRIKTDLEHNVDCKKVDDIIYKCFLNKENQGFTIFAIGNNKKGVLEKIYLKEQEEADKQENNKWDLSDESKSINEHIQAINDKKEVKNNYNNNQSAQLLYKLINNNVAKCINNKDWDGAIRGLVYNLKDLKDIFKYSKFDSTSIIKMIKDLKNQTEDPKFLDKLKKAKDIKEFDGSVLFNIDNI